MQTLITDESDSLVEPHLSFLLFFLEDCNIYKLDRPRVGFWDRIRDPSFKCLFEDLLLLLLMECSGNAY